jgi:prepilin-type N-terminal cleavage/methylation domain-containing protein
MIRQGRQPGFTLLELTLVMLIICVVLAVASPSLRGWSRESALRNAADDLLAVTRLARTQAITTCKTHRLCIPPEGGYYLMVFEGTEFVPVASDFGYPSQLVQGLRIELEKDPAAGPTGLIPRMSGQSRMPSGMSRMGYGQVQASEIPSDQPYIDFFPTGRTEPARLIVISEQSGQRVIACVAPAEPFEIVNNGAEY